MSQRALDMTQLQEETEAQSGQDLAWDYQVSHDWPWNLIPDPVGSLFQGIDAAAEGWRDLGSRASTETSIPTVSVQSGDKVRSWGRVYD